MSSSWGSSEDQSEDEFAWDEATRHSRAGSDWQSNSSEKQRALCHSCGRPLVRIAETGGVCWRAETLCAPTLECDRCCEPIFPGELHFECANCNLDVCKNCGPGVTIERSYDFVDRITGQCQVVEMTAENRHTRRRKLRSRSDSSPWESDLAERVVERLRKLSGQVVVEREEVFDDAWKEGGSLLSRLFDHNDLCSGVGDTLLWLARTAAQIFAQQPIITQAEAPCKVFGDIHGQLRDMLLLLESYGMPGAGLEFVFNGDFVDRGSHQLEVVGALFALKIAYPDKVWLNRGNHESAVMNHKYGFGVICTQQLGSELGPQVCHEFQAAFNWMPLACLIEERVLVIHGGLGDGNWSLDDLRTVRRPMDHTDLQNAPSFVWNILWSDPVEDDQEKNTFGVHQSPRGSKVPTYIFGWNVTQGFCERNDLDLVIRSHQAKNCGFGFDVMHGDTLIRVFSARDYERRGNDGAVLHISRCEDDDHDEDLLTVRAQVLRSLSKSRKSRG